MLKKNRVLWRLIPTLTQNQTHCLVVDKQTGLIYDSNFQGKQQNGWNASVLGSSYSDVQCYGKNAKEHGTENSSE